ncbi:unnamed protein product, partial [Thelazia callipaeda]|uniref:PH_RBD domain-containing protein n=1 Tax=Thelazia callipaeda TaxID=103827 RepID=A0A0N5CSM7_THECL
SSNKSLWDRIKSFFGSSDYDDDDVNVDHDPNSTSDAFNSDNTSSSGRKEVTNCPNDVDAVITNDGKNYLFSGSEIYEFDDKGINKEYSLKSLFPRGPPFVQGAMSNPRTHRTLLFHGKMVYVYSREMNSNKFVLESDYPKKLPANLNFQPMGAFLWSEGSQIITNGNNFATYDENWNRITLQNKIENYFDNFPRKPIRGKICFNTSCSI